MRVVALAGGTGAAKLLRGLAASLDPSALSIVVNTGDDAEVWGLHVSPDLDSVMYALAGVLDAGRGWPPTGRRRGSVSAIAISPRTSCARTRCAPDSRSRRSPPTWRGRSAWRRGSYR